MMHSDMLRLISAALAVFILASSQPIWAMSCAELLGDLAGHSDKKAEPVMDAPLIEWLEAKSLTLQNDYRTHGRYSEACGLLAFDAAELLTMAGESPSIGTYTGREIRISGLIDNESLVPPRYEGRVSWGAHVVAINNGYVYDPMVGKPVSLSEYPMLAFGTNDVKLKIRLDTDYIKDPLAE